MGTLRYPERGSRCTQPRADPTGLWGAAASPAFLALSGHAGFAHLFIFKDFFILERERAREGTEGEGERECQADSALSVELNSGLDPTTLRSRPESKPRLRCSSD